MRDLTDRMVVEDDGEVDVDPSRPARYSSSPFRFRALIDLPLLLCVLVFLSAAALFTKTELLLNRT